MTYIAIIADVIGSRKMEQRSEFQKTLKQVLSEINARYQQYIASDFVVIFGDEFQGLLMKNDRVMDIIFEIQLALAPVQCRFGIGIGTIDTDFSQSNPFEHDGPAYHRARDMVDYMKAHQSKQMQQYAKVRVHGSDDDALINAALSMSSAMQARWTVRQTEIITAFIQSGSHQFATAKSLGITQSSVAKALQSSQYYTFRNALDVIQEAISRKMN